MLKQKHIYYSLKISKTPNNIFVSYWNVLTHIYGLLMFIVLINIFITFIFLFPQLFF